MYLRDTKLSPDASHMANYAHNQRGGWHDTAAATTVTSTVWQRLRTCPKIIFVAATLQLIAHSVCSS